MRVPVQPPAGVEGRLRRAAPDDEELAVEWGRGFARDAKIDFPTPRSTVSRWIAAGDLFVWDVDDSPRSVAVASGRTRHGVRVGYRFCVLYTDLGNSTPNAIYATVGYEPLYDVVDIEVAPPD